MATGRAELRLSGFLEGDGEEGYSKIPRLRAAIHLAELRRARGERHSAREVVEAALAQIPEGEEMIEVIMARELIQACRGGPRG